MGMLISRALNLGKSQHQLDFVDIDLATDLPLFLDPVAFHNCPSAFAQACSNDISVFFEAVLDTAMRGNDEIGIELLSALREPNETQFGLSQGAPNGRGLGAGQAAVVFDRIKQSRAAQSGILEDLIDVSMFVGGIGPDKVSDMTTNIIRRHLIKYTQQQFANFGISISEEVPTGILWNSSSAQWEQEYDLVPSVQGRRILLVPKRYVRWSRGFGNPPQTFYNSYMTETIKQEQLRTGGRLVTMVPQKRGSPIPKVYKKDIKREIPPTKDNLAVFADNHREIYSRFKEAVFRHNPLSNRFLWELHQDDFDDSAVIEHIIASLNALPLGPRAADDYEIWSLEY
jgi:hypothetical protein